MERLLRLKQIKPSIIFYRDDANEKEKIFDGYIFNNREKQIQDILENLANSLIRGAQPPIYLPFTDNIGVCVYDLDTCKEDYEREVLKIRLANQNDEMNQGENVMFVSRSKLFSLDSIIEKQNYLVDCIYDSFMAYLEKFEINSEGLSQSYQRLKKSDFYFVTNKGNQYKKTNLYVLIQIQQDIDKDLYRLVLKDYDTNEILDLQQLPTRETKHTILNELDWIKASDDKILPAHSFQITGWKRDKFFFEFGYKGPTDYFEYDIKTKTLKQEINTNNPIEYKLPKVQKEKDVDWKFGRFLSEDYITLVLEKEFMPSKQNIQDFFKSKNIEIEFVKNDKSLLPSKSLNYLKDEEILLEKGNLLGILMYIEKNKNTYEWKLMNFCNEPEILDLLVFDFFDDINFTSIQSGDFFFSRSNWMDKKNSGELSEIQKMPTLDKNAFLTEINEPNSFLSSDVIEIELIKEDLYTANDLKAFYESRKIYIEFVTYWGDKLNSNEIRSNLHGVNIVKKGNSEGLQMELKESSKTLNLKLMNFSDDPTLFDIFIYQFFLSLNFKRISCGNMNFSKEEWLEFIKSKKFSEISKISTIET